MSKEIELLIITENKKPYETLITNLNMKYYVVNFSNYLDNSFFQLAKHLPSLIVLDLLTYNEELLAMIRQINHLEIPLIHVLDKDSLSNDLSNINISLNDFITRPVDDIELCYRIKSNILKNDKNKDRSALLTKERMQANIFRKTPVAIAFGYPDGSLANCNNSFLELTGYTQEELSKINWNKILTPIKWAKREAKELKKLTIKNNSIKYEKEYRHKNGTIIPIELVVSAKYDNDGNILYYIGFITNITERKQSEKALIESEQRYRSLFKDNYSIMLILDPVNGEIIDVNDSACNYYGYDYTTFTKMNINEINILSDSEIKAEIENACKAKRNHFYFKHKLSNGELRDVEVYSGKINYSEETVLYSIVYDITERKQAIKNLEISEDLLLEAQKRTHIAHWRFDPHTGLPWWSEELYRIYGYDPKDGPLPYEKHPDLIHPADWVRFDSIVKNTAATGEAFDIIIRIIRPDGNVRTINSICQPILDDLGNVFEMRGTVQDITKYKEAEEELRKQKELFELVINSVPMNIYWKDLNSTYLGCNTAFLNSVGKKELSEVVGKTDHDLIWGEVAQKFINDDKQVMNSRKARINYDESYKLPNSEEVFWHTNKMPLMDNNDTVFGILGTSEDVTQRINTLNTLKRSEDNLRKSQKIASLGSYVWNLIENKVIWSDEMYHIFGVDKETYDPNSNNYKDLVYEEDLHFLSDESIKKVLSKPVNNAEYRIVDQTTKQIKNIHLWSETSYDDLGNPVSVFGTFQDITDIKKAANELRKLSTAVMQSPSMIVITDTKGILTFSNPKFTQITEYIEDEVWGQNISILNSGELSREIYDELWKTISSGKTWRGEFHNKKKNGDLFWESASISPIFDSNDNIINYVKVAEDITEKKRTEVELMKVEKLRSIGTLAGGIAHDFNNLLTGIYGNVSLALLTMNESDPNYQYLTECEESMQRATKLTRQLLTFSKGGDPIKKYVNLTKIIEDIVTFDLSGSSLKPIFDFAEDVHELKADESQIEQVFSNLAINAKQASPKGGYLYISVHNCNVREGEILNLQPGEYIRIIVRDEGIGISALNIDRIFDPYFTTKENGTGLGLATTYSIINKHNGHLEIESTLHKGTQFTIYLPATSSKIFEEKVTPKLHTYSSEFPARILIMDDEEVIRDLLSRMLNLMGYKPDTASDGENVIAKYKQSLIENNAFDVLILDLTIPGGMGGRETIEQILQINKNAKVIVSSGYSSGLELTDFKSYGFKAKIDKPYTMTNLKEVITKVLLND